MQVGKTLFQQYCCCSVPKLCSTRDPMDCSTRDFPVLHYLQEFANTHVHWVSDVIQPFHPLLPPSPSALNLSQHQGFFQWVGSSHQVAKVLELQLQQQSSSEYSGLISFKVDWFDLLAVQGTLKSLLQHYSSKASVLWCSAFFMIQFLYLYITTGKTTALTVQILVGKVLSLLFTTLSRFVIPFLPRSKCLTIIWKILRGIGEDSWESLGQKENQTSHS